MIGLVNRNTDHYGMFKIAQLNNKNGWTKQHNGGIHVAV